ncbi:MAG: N-carbamoyl-D-amino-acid hydrolase [Polaromonas sp.]
MSRVIRVAAAQLGPTQKADSRAAVVDRMLRLLERAAGQKTQLVVFPELALTTFFPRWLLSEGQVNAYCETAMPNADVQPIFDCARDLEVGFYLGYAELTESGQRFNSAVTVAPAGNIIGHYRKVHLPGSIEPRADSVAQQLEKRYFSHGDFGFQAFRGPSEWHSPTLGMLICNDRRWPEGWRSYGLQGVEMMLMGYNSAAYDPNGGTEEDIERRTFHSLLVTQANAYMNSTWAISAAKAGVEDGFGLIAGSCIVDPNGMLIAQSTTAEDELLVADCDLDACRQGREKMFNFAAHRRPEHYRRIVDQVGVERPV